MLTLFLPLYVNLTLTSRGMLRLLPICYCCFKCKPHVDKINYADNTAYATLSLTHVNMKLRILAILELLYDENTMLIRTVLTVLPMLLLFYLNLLLIRSRMLEIFLTLWPLHVNLMLISTMLKILPRWLPLNDSCKPYVNKEWDAEKLLMVLPFYVTLKLTTSRMLKILPMVLPIYVYLMLLKGGC